MLRFFTEMPLSANLFPVESSIQKHPGAELLVGGAGGRSLPQKKKDKKKMSNIFSSKMIFILKVKVFFLIIV